MGFWSWLFGSNDSDGSDDDVHDRRHDAERKLSPAMPMAGAGAELSGEAENSETEQNLKRAAQNDGRAQ